MNITKAQLKQLIKEEIATSLREEEESWGPTVEDPELVAIDRLTAAVDEAINSGAAQQAVMAHEGANAAAFIIRNMAGLIGRVVRLAPDQQAEITDRLKAIMSDVAELQRSTGGYEQEWQEKDKPHGQPKAYSRTGTRTSVEGGSPEYGV